MSLKKLVAYLRARIRGVDRRQDDLADARKFRRSRTLFWRAKFHAARDPENRARYLLKARKSAGKGEQIEHSQHVLRERESKLRAALRRRLEQLRPPFSRNWGGSQGAAEELIRKAGLPRPPISSLKRPWWHALSRSNPGSDHNTANTSAYAVDFATFDGAGYAHRLARAAGWTSYRTGSYATFTYRASDGHLYRIQILWGVAGHWNHCHLGVRRVD